jgi:hypothetical protein
LGVDESNLGLEGSNLGAEERNLGLAEKNLGVEDRNLGVEERNLGVDDNNLGLEGKNLGVEGGNLGAEKRTEFCAGCIKDALFEVNSGSFLCFLFQVRTKRSHLYKWQDVSCGVALSATEGYRLRSTITETTNVFSYMYYIWNFRLSIRGSE